MSTGWHGVPGCAGCVDPVNMQHQEGCRLRAEAADHRHVADFLGRAVYIGDDVVAVARGPACGRPGGPKNPWNVRATILVRGKVLAITDKQVRLDINTGKAHMARDHELVKVRL